MTEETTTRAILITKPGIYPAITSRQYFSEPCPEPALTNSGIKTLLGKTAAEFAYTHPALNPDSPEGNASAVMRSGDVAHQLALGKGRGYAVGEYKDWRTKDAGTFKADALESGLTPVTAGEFAKAEASAEVMKSVVIETLQGMVGSAANPPTYETEVVIAWIEHTSSGPVWCRAMLDVWAPALGIILDPKFTERMADGVWETYATNMGYDMQAAWYMRGISALLPELAGRVRFINTLVSPKPPNISRVREADEATRYSCQLEIERALEIFGRCLRSNNWPAYPAMVEPWTARNWTLTQRAANQLEDGE